MPFILSIDTALDIAGICIADGDNILDVQTNNKQMDHASWIHMAIRDMLEKTGIDIKKLSAVAVTSGPGSYTGLRVGMATAKGISYALNIPLITETSLKLLAIAVNNKLTKGSTMDAFICSMIDARRMEVFTVVYDNDLNETTVPYALVLDENAYANELNRGRTIFVGNGTGKWIAICRHSNAVFSTESYSVRDLAGVAATKFLLKDFTKLAYSEPFYIKSFYTGVDK